MYDTVHLWVDYNQAGQILKETLFTNCTDIEEVQRFKNDKLRGYIKGYLPYPQHSKTGQGWDVWLFTSGIKIWGSPAKWLFGNNADTLTLKQAEESFRSLADALQLDFNTLTSARVQRLDFSSVICTEFVPKAYFPYLDWLPKFNRHLHHSGETLNYYQTEKHILFYDKRLDAENKGMRLPDWTKEKNLTRYEVRFNNPRRTILYKTKSEMIGDLDGKGNLYLKDLLSNHIYETCVDAWLYYYESIFKTIKPNTMITEERLLKPKDVFKSVLALAVAGMGIDVFDKLIQSRGISNPNLTKRQLKTALKKIEELAKEAPPTYPNLVEEMNGLVREKARELKERMYEE